MIGNELWVSPQLDGVASGSPLISDNGEYVYLTHNEDMISGIFSILSVTENGSTFFSMMNAINPFSPPAIFYNPAEGFYDDPNGLGNQNDLVLWSIAPKPDSNLLDPGATFAFQFPVDFTDENGIFSGDPEADLQYIVLSEQNFRAIAPPTITNEGRSAYWPMTLSAVLAWVGEEGDPTFHFNRAPFGAAGLTRDEDVPGQAIFASPALSRTKVSTEEVLFGGSAGLEFYRLDSNFSNEIVVATSSPIFGQAVVDPGDRVVYYAESSGVIHQANFDTLEDNWTYNVTVNPNLTVAVAGGIALHPNGDVLYIADTEGGITALEVADVSDQCILIVGDVDGRCQDLTRGQEPIGGCACYNYCGDALAEEGTGACCELGDRGCTTSCPGVEVLVAGCRLPEVSCIENHSSGCNTDDDCCDKRCGPQGFCQPNPANRKNPKLKQSGDRGGAAAKGRRLNNKSRLRGFVRGKSEPLHTVVHLEAG
jgi:hypothetical protein